MIIVNTAKQPNDRYVTYRRPKGVVEQVEYLHTLFPEIYSFSQEVDFSVLPEGAEGWFAIPRWQLIATDYEVAWQRVVIWLQRTRGCDNLPSWNVRPTDSAQDMLQTLSTSQGNPDILLVPAQFGLRYRDHSVEDAREVMGSHECGLDPFSVGIMLLTHPERLDHPDDLWIDCAGGEYLPPPGGDRIVMCPNFFLNEGRLGVDAHYIRVASNSCGSASMFT